MTCEEISLETSKNVFAVLHDFYAGKLNEFKAIHESGGFLTYDKRIIFAAPTALLAKGMARELGVQNAPTVTVKELGNWHAVDVTASTTWSAYTRRLHGMSTLYSDARCYSAVLYAHGWTRGIANTGSDFFKFFAESPLMRELPAADVLSGKVQPQKGDVIAVGSKEAKVPVDHVAIFAESASDFMGCMRFRQR